MNTKAETPIAVFDIVKQVFSVIFVVAGVAAFYYFSDEVRLLYRVLSLVAIMIAVAGMMFTTDLGHKVWAFILESKQEVRKIVWPTRDETMRTTLLVFAMVLIVGLILWLLDTILFKGITFLTGQGG